MVISQPYLVLSTLDLHYIADPYLINFEYIYLNPNAKNVDQTGSTTVEG